MSEVFPHAHPTCPILTITVTISTFELTRYWYGWMVVLCCMSYVSLAVRVVSNWKSTDPVESLTLSSSVSSLINQIFDTVERDYGGALTRSALGFITFSVGGVTDTEMCDLLTLDVDVLTSVCQYAQIDSVPSHVWLRLRAELYGLVTEKGHGCLGWVRVLIGGDSGVGEVLAVSLPSPYLVSVETCIECC